tara:strand:- start:1720 stop:2364 length:645 start_codon:yes stop_codon:yes gene_type:complete
LLGDGLLQLKDLALNELGDFLAGVFGPLALMWLILGFFQQGIELRQNREALQLQVAELNASVAQQRELVEVSREQLLAETAERESQREAAAIARVPQLTLDYRRMEADVERGCPAIVFTLYNARGHAFQVTVYSGKGGEGPVLAKQAILPECGEWEFSLPLAAGFAKQVRLYVLYQDAKHLQYQAFFDVSLRLKNGYPEVVDVGPLKSARASSA